MDFTFRILEKTPCKYPFKVESPQDAYNHFKDLAKANRECLAAVYLNPKNQAIDSEIVFAGTTDSSVVYPRDILRSAILNDAVSVIILHNHPSGDPGPSECDRSITKQILLALHSAGLKLLDHIIIGDGRYFSFTEEGLIEDYETMFKGLESTGLVAEPVKAGRYQPEPEPEPGTQFSLFDWCRASREKSRP
jgi:DNA repair protein RadC